MIASRLTALLVILWSLPSWGGPNQAPPGAVASESALLRIDESMFELAVATGGFYYFWAPGEFAEVAGDSGDSIALFAPGGRTVEQFDGRLQGALNLEFELDRDPGEMIVRVGMQGRGDIALWGPGRAPADATWSSQRTEHMLVVRVPDPRPGVWTVALEGAGAYLVNITARAREETPEETELDSGWGRGESGEPTQDDLARFRDASSEERWDLFRRLPTPRRNALARSLLEDPDPLVAYIAAGSLARDGHIDEAVPVFARILVRGEAETSLHGRMGYDWIHDDDPTLADRILSALGIYLRDHLDDYSGSERARAEAFLQQ